MFLFSTSAGAQVTILNDLVAQKVKVISLDSKQLHKERAKGYRYYLDLDATGGVYNFYVSVRNTPHRLFDKREEKNVIGIASQSFVSWAKDYYYDNEKKHLLWEYNISTNTLISNNSMVTPIIQWADYRSDGGFGYIKERGQVTGLTPTEGKSYNVIFRTN